MKTRNYAFLAIAVLLLVVGLKKADESQNKTGTDGGGGKSPDGLIETPTDGNRAGAIKTPRSPRDSRTSKTELVGRLAGILKSNDDTDVRMDKARAVVGELSKLLPASEVIGILNEQTGGGVEFSLLISEVFLRSGDDFDTLCGEVEKLPDPHSGSAVIGLIERISGKAGFDESLGRLLSAKLSPSALQGLGTAFHLEMARSSDPEARAKELFRLAGSLPKDAGQRYFPLLLAAVAKVAPEQVWAVEGDPVLGGLVSADQLKKLKDSALSELLSANHKVAVEFLLANSGSSAEFARAALVWANSNSQQFEAWLSEHAAELSSAEGDGLRSGYAQAKAGSSDFKTAWEMVGKIEDPKLKKQIEGAVWEKEKSALKSEVGKNPQEAIDGIVKGTSGFADYWLEEAVGTWVAKDFDSAIAWYDKTWKSLPESKSQYVAAAFATQSIREKDVDSARQWAALISDPKTRARIEAAIAKAGGK